MNTTTNLNISKEEPKSGYPLLTVSSVNNDSPNTLKEVIREDIKRSGPAGIDDAKAKRLKFSKGHKVSYDKYVDRRFDDINPNPKKQEKDMKEKILNEEVYAFTEGDSVEWDRMVDIKISDDKLSELIQEYSNKVTSSQCDFIKICMETMQIRSPEFLKNELIELNYSTSSVSKITKICGNKSIRKYINHLPTSWGSLYVLKDHDHRMIESLLGFKLVDEEKVPVDRDEYPGSEFIHRTTSKSTLVKEILKRRPKKTDEEVMEEFGEWFKVWTQRPVDHFDLNGINDTMETLSAIQKRTLIDWVRKTESLFIQMGFEKNVIVDVRLKS